MRTSWPSSCPGRSRRWTSRARACSSDPDTGRNEKVVTWSYVLEYNGRFEDEVSGATYLDGGDALCYEPVGRSPRYCD